MSSEMNNGAGFRRRELLLGGTSLVAAASLPATGLTKSAQAQPTPAPAPSGGRKPNIVVIMGDDIGWFNVSACNMGIMGYRTPNIDRIGKEGTVFTDWYGQ
jgi:arylsulfatase